MFAKNLRLFYLYLVSFIALLTMIFALYGTAVAGMEIVFPAGYTYGTDWVGIDVDKAVDKSILYRNLFNTCAFWLVALPVYYFHWQAIKGERARNKIAEQAEVAEKFEK